MEDDDESSITLNVTVQRHASYVMLTMFFPLLMLVILNVCVFLLPCGSGEKNSYAVTVFLSFAVFLTMINSTLPDNADSVALFSIYLVVLTLQSTVITVLALIFSRFVTFDEMKIPIPPTLIKLSNLMKVKWFMSRKVNIHDDCEDANTDDDKDKHTHDVSKATVTWETVVNGLDCLCFVIFLIFSILITILFVALSAGVTS